MVWYTLILVGLAGGVIGGMGMGGGTLLIPLLTMLVGYSQIEAQAINLLSFIPMAVISLILLIKNKLVDFKSLLILTPLAVAGCVFGALFSDKINSVYLGKIFGAFILLIGIIFLLKTIIGLGSEYLAKKSH